MRIAQLAPLYERVPPRLYGGTERVVSYVTEGLVRRGHSVTLFASGDSVTAARLVSGAARRALRLDPDAGDPLYVHVLQLSQAFERAADFDVIHCHVDALAFPFARFTRTPTVHTLHGRLDLPHMRPIYRHFRDLPLVSISDSQREPVADLDLNWVTTVHHGIPPEEFPFSGRPGRYLAFLGRVSREKRVDLAIAAAVRAQVPLRIAAKVDPSDQAYFEAEVRPLLDHPLVEFLGEVGGEARGGFLAGAMGLLFPIDWPEPFGLVMIEALACGTPVIARPRGSVREVVVPGRTGYLAETVDDMVAAIRRLDRIDRAACRRDVEERFSVHRMVADYEAAYDRLLRRARSA